MASSAVVMASAASSTAVWAVSTSLRAFFWAVPSGSSASSSASSDVARACCAFFILKLASSIVSAGGCSSSSRAFCAFCRLTSASLYTLLASISAASSIVRSTSPACTRSPTSTLTSFTLPEKGIPIVSRVAYRRLPFIETAFDRLPRRTAMTCTSCVASIPNCDRSDAADWLPSNLV